MLRRPESKIAGDRVSGLRQTLSEQFLYVSLIFDTEAHRNNTRSKASHDNMNNTMKTATTY